LYIALSSGIASGPGDLVLHVLKCTYLRRRLLELKLYVNHSKSIERFPEYVNNYILGTRDHWEYLEKVGGLRRMNELKADRILGRRSEDKWKPEFRERSDTARNTSASLPPAYSAYAS